MSEIPKAYEPQSVEDKWYDFWQKQGCFTAEPARVSERRPAYSIVIPPPNVTGMLHMGHVLNNTIQDILSRKARMDSMEYALVRKCTDCLWTGVQAFSIHDNREEKSS